MQIHLSVMVARAGQPLKGLTECHLEQASEERGHDGQKHHGGNLERSRSYRRVNISRAEVE